MLSSTGAVCWHLSLLPSTPSTLRQNDVSSSSRGSTGAGTTTCSNPPACCGLILKYSQQGCQSDSAHCFPVAHPRKPPEYSPPGDEGVRAGEVVHPKISKLTQETAVDATEATVSLHASFFRRAHAKRYNLFGVDSCFAQISLVVHVRDFQHIFRT